KCLTVRGSVPMKEGMLLVACTVESPFRSVSTHEKSCDSRTSVENEARTSAAAASSTEEVSRVHSTSRVAASKLATLALLTSDGRRVSAGAVWHRSHDVPLGTGTERRPRPDDQRGLWLFYDRRALVLEIGNQPGTV